VKVPHPDAREDTPRRSGIRRRIETFVAAGTRNRLRCPMLLKQVQLVAAERW
jgi:hypothetical protein